MTIRRKSRAGLAGLILLFLLFGLRLEAQDYTLARGDVIEITVFRVPELSRQVEVDFSDHIAFPPLGRIDVAGRTLEEVGDRIRTALAEREILLDAQVTVGLIEARPVIVGGDVASPGAYPYRPELSVRRAIALAGGVGTLREGRSDLAAELLGDQRGVRNELMRLEANVARIEAELEGREDVQAEDFAMLPAPLSQLETRELEFNVEERRQEKALLEERREILETRIGFLKSQIGFQEEAISIQREELDRVQQVEQQGLTVRSRLNNERQAFANLQERAADTESELANAQSQLAEADSQLQRFDNRREADLRAELQQALYDMASARTELSSLQARLAQLGYTDGSQFEIFLYRFEEGREISRAVSEETILKPGDMIEVQVSTAPAGLAAGARGALAGGSEAEAGTGGEAAAGQ